MQAVAINAGIKVAGVVGAQLKVPVFLVPLTVPVTVGINPPALRVPVIVAALSS